MANGTDSNHAQQGYPHGGAHSLSPRSYQPVTFPGGREAGPLEKSYDGMFLGSDGKVYPPGTNPSVVPAFQPSAGNTSGARIVFVNGMLTPANDDTQVCQSLADATGAQVVALHNSTEGLPNDLGQAITDKTARAERAVGIPDQNKATATLANTIQDSIDRNEPINVFGHSQGGLIISSALNEVHDRMLASGQYSVEEVRERLSLVHVQTFGGAAYTYPQGPDYYHFVNKADGIAQLVGLSQEDHSWWLPETVLGNVLPYDPLANAPLPDDLHNLVKGIQPDFVRDGAHYHVFDFPQPNKDYDDGHTEYVPAHAWRVYADELRNDKEALSRISNPDVTQESLPGAQDGQAVPAGEVGLPNQDQDAGEQSVLGAQQGQAGVPAGEVGLPNQDQDAGEQSVLGAQQGQAGVPAGEVGLPNQDQDAGEQSVSGAQHLLLRGHVEVTEVSPGLIDWNAGTGDEPLFGDVTPGGASGGQGPVAGVGDVFAVNTDTPGPQAVTPGLIDWNAGTGDEPLFGDVTPGGASGGQGPVAGVGDVFAVNTDTPGPQAVTPGLTDWNAGTGDEPLFGDVTPGGASGGQGPVAGVGDVFAVNTDTPGPQAVTPGLTDWNAGTGDEPLFGDVTPGGASGGQGPVAGSAT